MAENYFHRIGQSRYALCAVLCILLAALGAYHFLRPEIGFLMNLQGRKTRAQRLDEFRTAASARLLPAFARKSVSYPPEDVTLLAVKQSRQIELYAGNSGELLRHIKNYTVQAASGKLGPKLTEGDLQVPEGVYRVQSLNPNSAFHLSLQLDYPNEFDTTMARIDHRSQLGGEIFVHGGAASVGCLAVGNPAVEELFMLAADTGLENLKVIIAPVDLRTQPRPTIDGPDWISNLYEALSKEMAVLKPE